ncbi:hypothetical protein MFU01_29980 [Myxococcus fulvus]|uniref:Uncharacterized protein n=1 Tax=Myxococcus fulvus TaxID=33 RepID=A0A511T1D7_MYXFU|nr:hypothetical protein MFU01_29980 [Myxococcus fulvus]
MTRIGAIPVPPAHEATSEQAHITGAADPCIRQAGARKAMHRARARRLDARPHQEHHAKARHTLLPGARIMSRGSSHQERHAEARQRHLLNACASEPPDAHSQRTRTGQA